MQDDSAARAAMREELADALADNEAQFSRVDTCRRISQRIAEAGQALWVAAYNQKDRPLEGLALVTEIAGELAVGAVSLFEAERWFAGASLVRQLVEAEYLCWQFSVDPKEAATWLDATPAKLRKEFTPSRMRKRSAGRFRDAEYWTHCDLGGHPNPKGRLLLLDHTNPIGSHRFVWVDLAQHLERLWAFILTAVDSMDASKLIPEDQRFETQAAIARWHDQDPLARRIPLP